MKQFLKRWVVELAIGAPIFWIAYAVGIWDALPYWGFVIFCIGVWRIVGWVADQLGLEVKP